MALIDDTSLPRRGESLELVRPIGRRRITHAIHDVDGTHSRIRQWPPVMSRCLHYAMHCGLGEDFDDPARVADLVARVGIEPLEETDRFCIESAGLSGLTQMEWAIRRAVQLGNAPDAVAASLSSEQQAGNTEIIQRIWRGQERYDDIDQPAALAAFIADRAPRLFQLYEKALGDACRDHNLADARANPEHWRFPGSIRFMEHLRDAGCVNYFVTGAVLYEAGGMLEEMEVLGFEVGPGQLVEAIHGSEWDRKIPKDEVMRRLFGELGVDPAAAIVIGDGRKEIEAGATMGCVTVSRLDADATRARELHIELGTQAILHDYTDPLLYRLITPET